MKSKKKKSISGPSRSLSFRLLVFLALLVALVGAIFATYWVYVYFNQNSLQQKSVELPGLQLYSVQESDFNKVYSLYINYPKIDEAAFDTAVLGIVNTSKTDFTKAVAGKKAGDYPLNDLNVSYAVNFYNDTFLSVDVTTHSAVEGTVKDFERTVLYDRKAHDVIDIYDLFVAKADYLKVFSEQSRTKLKTILGKDYNQAQVEKATTEDSANFKYFTVDTKRNLVLVFDAGQVADANIGIVHVPISANNMADILKKPYADDLLRIATQKLTIPPKPLTQETSNGAVPQADPTGVDCAKAKCIALTFDDGPSYTTPQLLDTLKANNVKATFFELGIQAQKYPSNTKRVVAEGHVIGNHTYDHQNLLTMSLDNARGEINRAADSIQSAGGVRPGLVRAPYGATNTALANELKTVFINWNIDPNDWKDRDASIVHDRVMAAAKPGAIILSHDIYQTTVDAYKRIIPELIKQGYVLVTVPQLLGFGENTAPGVYFSR